LIESCVPSFKESQSVCLGRFDHCREIGAGLCVLLGVGKQDGDTDADFLAEKIRTCGSSKTITEK